MGIKQIFTKRVSFRKISVTIRNTIEILYPHGNTHQLINMKHHKKSQKNISEPLFLKPVHRYRRILFDKTVTS